MPNHGLDLDSDDSDANENYVNSLRSLIGNNLELSHTLLPPDFTDKLRLALPDDDDAGADLVVMAPDSIAALKLNVPLLLELMSWGNSACRTYLKIKNAQTDLMQYKNLPHIGKDKWECLPGTSACNGDAIYTKVERLGNVQLPLSRDLLSFEMTGGRHAFSE